MNDEVADIIDELLADSQVSEDIVVYHGVTQEPKDIIKEFFPSNSGLCICEGLNGIRFEKQQDFSSDDMMIRLKVFDEDGDLEIWRIDENFGWRFIGKPKGNQKHEQLELDKDHWFVREIKVNLWGSESRDGQRFESRMAAANLRYPIDDTSKPVNLRIREYSRKGTLQFVRYVSLETEGDK